MVIKLKQVVGKRINKKWCLCLVFIRNIPKRMNYNIMKYLDSHLVSWSMVGDAILFYIES